MSDDENEVADLSSPIVVDKYKSASDIANKTMTLLLENLTVGSSVSKLCKLGDETIVKLVAGCFTKDKKLEKGIAFPTCISVNNVAGHYSPLDPEDYIIKEGDLVKIDLSVHIDGFVGSLAHTTIALADNTVQTTGRKADVICAAHFAGEVAIRLMKPGNKNTQVTEGIKAVADQFHVTPLEGVLSHQLKRFVLDGNRVIINKETPDQHVEEFTFEEGEVYSLDIVMSTGEGKTRELEAKPTVFRRKADENYQLKLNSARQALREIEKKHNTMAFNCRDLDVKLRLGLLECVRNNLLIPYPVLYEKPDALVAQFKFTVLILPSGNQKLANQPLPYVSSEYSITDPKLSALLQTGLKRKPAKKKNKKKNTTNAEEAPIDE